MDEKRKLNQNGKTVGLPKQKSDEKNDTAEEDDELGMEAGQGTEEPRSTTAEIVVGRRRGIFQRKRRRYNKAMEEFYIPFCFNIGILQYLPYTSFYLHFLRIMVREISK